jgi:hypothetical protein
MTKKPKHKSEAFEAIHSAVEGMLRVGTIDKAIIRRFDESRITSLAPIKPWRSISWAQQGMSAGGWIRASQPLDHPAFRDYSYETDCIIEV